MVVDPDQLASSVASSSRTLLLSFQKRVYISYMVHLSGKIMYLMWMIVCVIVLWQWRSHTLKYCAHQR